MKQKIIDVLRKSPCPLTAPEIGKEIGCQKKQVNQIIYKISVVEQVANTQPPKWRLKQDSSGTTPGDDTVKVQDSAVSSTVTTTTSGAEKVGATMSPVKSKSDPLTPGSNLCNDDELRSHILDILKLLSTPLSAPEISRQLSGKITHNISDCKRVLHELLREGRVDRSLAGTKPLWILKGSSSSANDSDNVELNGKLVCTFEDTGDEFRFKKVSKTELLRLSSGESKQRIEVSSDQIKSSSGQVQSNIDQVNTSSDQIDTSIDTHHTTHDDKLSIKSRNDVVTLIPRSGKPETLPDTTTPIVGENDPSVDFSSKSDEDPSVDLSNSSPSADRKPFSMLPCKRKPQLAANFSVSSNNEQSLRERIFELLENNKKQEFNARQVSQELGLDTRDEVLYWLEKLVEEDKIEKLNNQSYKYKE